MGNIRIGIFTIQDEYIYFLINSIMNILDKLKELWQRWRRIVSFSHN